MLQSPKQKIMTFSAFIASFCFLATSNVACAQNAFGKARFPFDVIRESGVRIKMRDGVRLASDIYIPQGDLEKWPTILIRTPYGRHLKPAEDAEFFAGNGFVVIVQDLRGKFASEGRFQVMSGADPKDGYETLTWIADQPWSNGKIGTYGCSYLGETQVALLAQNHPNHIAAIAQAAGGNYAGRGTFFGQYEGGVPELAGAVSWHYGAPRAGAKVRYQLPRQLDDRSFGAIEDFYQASFTIPGFDTSVYHRLPSIGILKSLSPIPTDYAEFIRLGPGSEKWRSLGYTWPDDQFSAAVLHVDSWFNGSIAEQLDLFGLMQENALTERARDHQYAIVSPHLHCKSERFASEDTVISDMDLGDTRLDYAGLYLEWFRHWLMPEAPKRALSWPRMRLFTMGANEWRSHDAWPPKSKMTKLFLASDGSANSRYGDGRLVLQPSDSDAASDRFVYDPGNPVLSVGGPVTIGSLPSGPVNQNPVSARHDVLVYTTPPLAQDVEVTGEIAAYLYVSSDVPDTDFAVQLVDVDPNGEGIWVQSGILRMRYRDGFDKTRRMDTGEMYPIRIDLHATSLVLKKGHRLRIQIAGSAFPHFERNLNTGGRNYDETSWNIANSTVHHTLGEQSFIELPVRDGDLKFEQVNCPDDE